MSDPKHHLPVVHHRQHPVAVREPSPKLTSNGGGTLVWLGIGAAALFAIGRLSSSGVGNTTDLSPVMSAQDAIGNAVAAQAPLPIEPLNAASVKRGIGDMKLANARESLAGEMIYSQNCFDALSRHFSWAKLDRCGAFDMAAVNALGDTVATGFDKEIAWFENEAAAGRYLKAAGAAGAAADAADTRLSALQRRMPKARPVPAAVALPDFEDEATAGANDSSVLTTASNETDE